MSRLSIPLTIDVGPHDAMSSGHGSQGYAYGRPPADPNFCNLCTPPSYRPANPGLPSGYGNQDSVLKIYNPYENFLLTEVRPSLPVMHPMLANVPSPLRPNVQPDPYCLSYNYGSPVFESPSGSGLYQGVPMQYMPVAGPSVPMQLPHNYLGYSHANYPYVRPGTPVPTYVQAPVPQCSYMVNPAQASQPMHRQMHQPAHQVMHKPPQQPPKQSMHHAPQPKPPQQPPKQSMHQAPQPRHQPVYQAPHHMMQDTKRNPKHQSAYKPRHQPSSNPPSQQPRQSPPQPPPLVSDRRRPEGTSRIRQIPNQSGYPRSAPTERSHSGFSEPAPRRRDSRRCPDVQRINPTLENVRINDRFDLGAHHSRPMSRYVSRDWPGQFEAPPARMVPVPLESRRPPAADRACAPPAHTQPYSRTPHSLASPSRSDERTAHAPSPREIEPSTSTTAKSSPSATFRFRNLPRPPTTYCTATPRDEKAILSISRPTLTEDIPDETVGSSSVAGPAASAGRDTAGTGGSNPLDCSVPRSSCHWHADSTTTGDSTPPLQPTLAYSPRDLSPRHEQEEANQIITVNYTESGPGAECEADRPKSAESAANEGDVLESSNDYPTAGTSSWLSSEDNTTAGISGADEGDAPESLSDSLTARTSGFASEDPNNVGIAPAENIDRDSEEEFIDEFDSDSDLSIWEGGENPWVTFARRHMEPSGLRSMNLLPIGRQFPDLFEEPQRGAPGPFPCNGMRRDHPGPSRVVPPRLVSRCEVCSEPLGLVFCSGCQTLVPMHWCGCVRDQCPNCEAPSQLRGPCREPPHRRGDDGAGGAGGAGPSTESAPAQEYDESPSPPAYPCPVDAPPSSMSAVPEKLIDKLTGPATEAIIERRSSIKAF